MGPVWHKQLLVNVVAFFVALNMAVGVVAVSSRREQGSMAMAGHVKKPATQAPPADRNTTGTQPTRSPSNSDQVAAGATESPGPADAGGAVAPAVNPTGATTPTAPPTSGTTGSRRQTTTTARRSSPSTGTSPTTAPAGATATGDQGATTETTAPPATDPGAITPMGTDTSAKPKPTTTTTAKPAPPGPSTQQFDDPAGDSVVDGTTTARALGRADVVRSKANYTAKAILLAVQTAEPVDPKTDPRWASENTYVSWDIDTNLDGTVDYIAEFFVEGGELGADITRADDAAATSLCGVEAAYSSDGYTVGIDPACIGNPAAIAYRATIFYDTSTEVVSDIAPNSGWSRSVGRPKS